jgi:hypothetical protein
MLGRVLINRGAADQGAFDVRYAPDSGAKADIAGLPRWARTGHLVVLDRRQTRDGKVINFVQIRIWCEC